MAEPAEKPYVLPDQRFAPGANRFYIFVSNGHCLLSQTEDAPIDLVSMERKIDG